MRPAHLAFILFIDLCWAFNIIAVKIAVEAVEPLAAAALRYLIVCVVALPFIRWVPGRMHLVLGVGALAGALFMLLVNLSLAVTDNVAALAIAGQLGAPFSLILAVLFLGERIHLPRIAGTALAFVGVAIMGFDPAIWDERLGVGLTILSSVVWAVGSLMFRNLRDVHALTVHGWLALVSFPILGILSLVVEPGAFAALDDVPLGIFGWIAFSAIFSSIIGHAGMSYLLQHYELGVLVPLTLPTPLISAGIAVLLFGTPVSTSLIAGALVSFVGVAIITVRSAARRTDVAETWVRRARR